MKQINAKILVLPCLSVALGFTAMAMAKTRSSPSGAEPMVWDVRTLETGKGYEIARDKFLLDGWEPYASYPSVYDLRSNGTTTTDGYDVYRNYTGLAESVNVTEFRKQVPLSVVKARLARLQAAAKK